MTHRFVVPSSLVFPLRAEQTTAIGPSRRADLFLSAKKRVETRGQCQRNRSYKHISTTSSGSRPQTVPPNFSTSRFSAAVSAFSLIPLTRLPLVCEDEPLQRTSGAMLGAYCVRREILEMFEGLAWLVSQSKCECA